MSVNTNINNSKTSQNTSSMQLTTAQKEKFLDYLEKKGLPAPKGSSNEYDNTNLLISMVESIVFQIQEALQEKMSEVRLEELKNNLSLKIFNQALTLNLGDLSKIDPDAAKEILELSDFDEMLIKIGLYVEAFPNFAISFTQYLIDSYFVICLENSIKPDVQILEFYKIVTNPASILTA